MLTSSAQVRVLITAFAAGCFVAAGWQWLGGNSTYILGFTAVLLAALFLFWHHKALRITYAALLALALGILFTNLYMHYFAAAPAFYGEYSGTGVIVAEPEQKTTYQQLIVRVERENRNVLVRAEHYPEFEYGNKVSLSGNIDKVESFETDEGKVFDYPQYLLMRYRVVGIVKKPESIKKVGSGKGNPVVAAVLSVKHKFEDVIAKTLPEPYAALDQGLLTGTRANFTEKFQEALRRTGTTHIIAISGYNVTIILAIFFLFVRRSAGFWAGIVSGLLALLLFTILTGASASIVRAAIMGSLFLVAKLVGRQTRVEHTLFIAAAIMILFNPLIVRFDAGFQLSFLAVLGLVYFSPKFAKWFGKIKFYEKVPGVVREAIEATFGAQMVAWPVILILFGQISIIAPLVNAVILPIIPLTMALGFGAAAMALALPPLGTTIAILPWLLLSLIVVIISAAAKLPYAVVQAHNLSAWWLVVWFVFMFAWINYDTIKTQLAKLKI